MAKKNMSLTKVPMPEQAPDVRNKNFNLTFADMKISN